MPIYTAVVTGVAADTILGGAIANVVAQMRVYLAISIDNDTRGCSGTFLRPPLCRGQNCKCKNRSAVPSMLILSHHF